VNSLNWKCEIFVSGDLATRLNDEMAPRTVGAFGMGNDLSGLARLVRRGVFELAMGRRSPQWENEVDQVLRESRFVVAMAVGQADSPFQLACAEQGAHGHFIGLLLDILIARRSPGYRLRRCFQDGAWFTPSSRSTVSKFCSARCRNRFNYEINGLGSQFVCANCTKVSGLSSFSGLALENQRAEPADIKTAEPVCVACAKIGFPEWTQYLISADLVEPVPVPRSDETHEYVQEVNDLISEALAAVEGPLHFTKIAAYVASRMALRGGNAEMTVLGYLLRSPNRYRATGKRTFILAERTRKAYMAGAAGGTA
jgi:hypothetical protein